MNLPDRLLMPEEVSEILGVSVKTLYAWRHRRIGPPAVRVGKHLRYDPARLREWIDQLGDAQKDR